ncbi:disease resistance protein Roq1-like isoform X4 [Prosopis cineraria]|uniref:disease resistance protein Roq1-like isoform X4 n=1 Tax=Prosopis cineraria TaxID=364024 RepID=UPI00240FD192|nr:disease resistance protein Roq1-like isoform X4 [Prosopis cineraria]
MAQLALCSSINDKWDYDVFLSFHGEDTRLCFVSILRESLRQRGIRVFIDDEFIRTGEEITPALLKAIQESRIAIIVFSENYASSTFCLEELEKILECFKEEGRLIYPVSYYVDPSELRRPRGSYAKALAGLEKRFEDNIQKVQKWRLALFQAANLKGCHLKSKIANEQECITKIISEVSTKINHDLVDITRHPVGLMSRVKEVISLLELWSTEKTKMALNLQPGKRNFIFPGGKFPENLDNYDPRTNDDCSSWQRVQKSQNCEELEDDVPYLDIDTRMANLYERAYPSRWIYDVFLSYGGDYGCSSFVSRLCNSMCAKRIRILPNDEFLTPSVEEFNAMEESRIAIIIISENYGSSTSCLNSLATILECFRKECRSVYTIFYNVEPSKLQYQTGNCEELFAMLEKKLKHSKQQVQQWRLALSEVVSRGRYYYFNRNPNLRNAKEDKFIQGFIYAISSSINAFPFRIRDDSVGLESRVQEIISLLDVGSNEEVKMVGICGIFGIGKSALARAVCNFIAHHFEDLWYFSPISEEYRTLGNFLYPLCLTEKARGNYSSLDNFLRIIRQPWFPQRKNLVILDGVEELDHL